jgi:transposase-like protein
VSAHDQDEVKADFWAIFDVGDAEPGDQAIAVAHRQAGEFAAKWKARYPSAVSCVTDDLASLTVHLRFPAEHWRRIRHSNFIERTPVRPAGASRSSAGSPARAHACRWCGPSSTAPVAAGAGSP